MRVSDSKFGFLLTLPGLAFLLTIIILPFMYLVIISFLRYEYVNPVAWCGFNNYVSVITHRLFPTAFKNMLIFAGGSTALTILVSLVLAHTLSRISRGSTFFRSLMIMPWAVPLVLTGFIWSWIFNPSYGMISDMLMKVGLIHEPLNIFVNPNLSMLGVIIAYAWSHIPLSTVLILAGLESIPQNLYEAAKVDGADAFDTFIHISLPLNAHSIFISTLMTLMFSLRTIDVIYSMTPGGGLGKCTYVLAMFGYDHLYRYGEPGYAAAAFMLLTLITFGIGSYLIKEFLREGG